MNRPQSSSHDEVLAFFRGRGTDVLPAFARDWPRERLLRAYGTGVPPSQWGPDFAEGPPPARRKEPRMPPISTFRKALLGAAVAAGAVLVQGLSDAGLSVAEGAGTVFAGLVAFAGVYGVRNEGPRR